VKSKVKSENSNQVNHSYLNSFQMIIFKSHTR